MNSGCRGSKSGCCLAIQAAAFCARMCPLWCKKVDTLLHKKQPLCGSKSGKKASAFCARQRTFSHKKQPLSCNKSACTKIGCFLVLKGAAFLHQQRLPCGSKGGRFLCKNASSFGARKQTLCCTKSGCRVAQKAARKHPLFVQDRD